MVLLSMTGSLKVTLPRSGFVQQVISAGRITAGCCSYLAILANNYLPLNEALYFYRQLMRITLQSSND